MRSWHRFSVCFTDSRMSGGIKSNANLNHCLATHLLQLLNEFGVRDICIAPGSRSAPLVIAADQQTSDTARRFELHSHLDERALGFFALGLIKATHRPVAVITTSGTAVANLYPAVVEACQCSLPLIVLSADRPEELLNCGANQAINQKSMFGENAVGFVQLPPLEQPDTIAEHLRGVMELLANLVGPVQINCAFREPLYPDSTLPFASSEALQVASTNLPESETPQSTDCVSLQQRVLQDQPTLIVAGDLTTTEAAAVLALAERCEVPLLADINSGLPQHRLVIQGTELLLASAPELLGGYRQVLQFGGRIVGKRLLSWLADGDFCRYLLVSNQALKLDPSRTAEQIQADIPAFCDALSLSAGEHQPLFSAYKTIQVQANRFIDDCGFGELHAVRSIARTASAEVDLFVGNSLSIRLLDLQSCRNSPVFSNRGASGIDGLLATACGVHRGRGRPTMVLLGDTSLLHDLNSLLLARNSQTDHALVIVVLNNDGGSIFNLLPAAELQNTHTQFFQMPHGTKFEHAAEMFGVAYRAPDNAESFNDCLQQALQANRVSLIELIVPAAESSEQIRQLYRHLSLAARDNRSSH